MVPRRMGSPEGAPPPSGALLSGALDSAAGAEGAAEGAGVAVQAASRPPSMATAHSIAMSFFNFIVMPP